MAILPRLSHGFSYEMQTSSTNRNAHRARERLCYRHAVSVRDHEQKHPGQREQRSKAKRRICDLYILSNEQCPVTGRDEWTSIQWLRPLYQPADRPKSSGVDDMLDMRVEELMKTLIGSKRFDGRIIRFNIMQTCISWQQFRKVPTKDFSSGSDMGFNWYSFSALYCS